jgi:hypothetical protein
MAPLLWLQLNLDSLSKWAQVSLATLGYITLGGSISGFYIKSRLDRFEKELFQKIDSKFVLKEVCRYKHPELSDSARFLLGEDHGKGME